MGMKLRTWRILCLFTTGTSLGIGTDVGNAGIGVNGGASGAWLDVAVGVANGVPIGVVNGVTIGVVNSVVAFVVGVAVGVTICGEFTDCNSIADKPELTSTCAFDISGSFMSLLGDTTRMIAPPVLEDMSCDAARTDVPTFASCTVAGMGKRNGFDSMLAVEIVAVGIAVATVGKADFGTTLMAAVMRGNV